MTRPALRAGLKLAALGMGALGMVALAGCTPWPREIYPPLAPQQAIGPVPLEPAPAARRNGPIGRSAPLPAPQVSYGAAMPAGAAAGPQAGVAGAGVTTPGAAGAAGGDISLDFADTDIREVVAQILGRLLGVNYTIDPAVRGTATLHTTVPLSRAQLLPTLQALLAQAGAGLVRAGSLYRVVPAAAAAADIGLADLGGAGSSLVPLRYASAASLARVLQPFAGQSGRILPAPDSNALLVSGDPAARQTLIELIRAFDVDILAGQSYALLPVESGDAKDFASTLQQAVRAQGSAALAGLVQVLPMARLNAVLVVASTPAYVDQVRRIYGLVTRTRSRTVRSWHVYYLQNGKSNDAAYLLQQAFTPGDVTAQPSTRAPPTSVGGTSTLGAGGIGAGGINSPGGIGGRGGGGLGAVPGASAPPGETAAPAAGGGSAAAANPLLGGLEGGGAGGGPGGGGTEQIRIIPSPQNNALMIYATPAENDRIEAMLRKIDIVPLQVRIDATIAEVTLDDALQYGTQFFFKSGGINGVLNNALVNAPIDNLANIALGTTFPGFVLAGKGAGGAPLAISALQAVTDVRVLSSPQIMVLDNETARLQVGSLVPYLSTSSQSTLVSGAPIINNVQYQPTGVILQVTPRVNAGDLVTLDIAQEVSAVVPPNTNASGSTIDSPTFSERNVTSRVVIRDGQTVGLAGLISDNVSRSNTGIPWLKDIPLLGLLAGTQDNRRTRTELLVLITPHVVHDQLDARALTRDLQEQLPNAASVPGRLRGLDASGRADPNGFLFRDPRLGP